MIFVASRVASKTRRDSRATFRALQSYFECSSLSLSGAPPGCPQKSLGRVSLKQCIHDPRDAGTSDNSAALLNINDSPDPQTMRVNFGRDESDSAANGLPRQHLVTADVVMLAGREIIIADFVGGTVARERRCLPSALSEQSDFSFDIGSAHKRLTSYSPANAEGVVGICSWHIGFWVCGGRGEQGGASLSRTESRGFSGWWPGSSWSADFADLRRWLSGQSARICEICGQNNAAVVFQQAVIALLRSAARTHAGRMITTLLLPASLSVSLMTNTLTTSFVPGPVRPCEVLNTAGSFGPCWARRVARSGL